MIAKNRIIVILFAAWTFILLALVTIYNNLKFDTLFIFSFIGFLFIIGLSGPFTSKPKWRSRVGVVIAIGALIFLVLVVIKLYTVIITPLPPAGV